MTFVPNTSSYIKIAVVLPQSFHFLCSAGWVDSGGEQPVDDNPHGLHKVSAQFMMRSRSHF